MAIREDRNEEASANSDRGYKGLSEEQNDYVHDDLHRFDFTMPLLLQRDVTEEDREQYKRQRIEAYRAHNGRTEDEQALWACVRNEETYELARPHLTNSDTRNRFAEAVIALQNKRLHMCSCGVKCDPLTRGQCTPSFAQFCALTAVNAQRHFAHTSKFNMQGETSYGARVNLERRDKLYCSNGAFIVYMQANGFGMKRARNTPNVFLKAKVRGTK